LEGQTTNTTQKRLRILGDDEIQALYGRPRFTGDERLEYFALSPTEKATLEQLHSSKSRIYFILQLGYFKSHHLFFVFDLPDVAEDARYIQAHYFPDVQLDDLDITKVTRLRQQRLILTLFRYRTCDAAQRQALVAKAQQAATVSSTLLSSENSCITWLNNGLSLPATPSCKRRSARPSRRNKSG
jgi:hypothetical protein